MSGQQNTFKDTKSDAMPAGPVWTKVELVIKKMQIKVPRVAPWDYTSFDAHGDRGMMYQLFGNKMNAINSEINVALAAA